jgi:methionyl-tRNA formyltransferase
MKITIGSISEVELAPREMRKVEGDLLIGTATKAIVVATVTPSGKPSLAASAWLNGARLVDGESCE